MDDELVLNVEPVDFHFAMHHDRVGNRGRLEGETAVRWLRRWIQRRAATITRDVRLELPNGCLVGDHFITNRQCMVVSTWAIVGGRQAGLPEKLLTDASSITVPRDPFDRRPVAPEA